MSDLAEGTFELWINDERYLVDQPRVSVRQVRAMAAIPPEHQLVVEGEGSQHDWLLGDEAIIELSSRLRCYSRPPSSFGSAGPNPC